jgi:hypothetical protein
MHGCRGLHGMIGRHTGASYRYLRTHWVAQFTPRNAWPAPHELVSRCRPRAAIRGNAQILLICLLMYTPAYLHFTSSRHLVRLEVFRTVRSSRLPRHSTMSEHGGCSLQPTQSTFRDGTATSVIPYTPPPSPQPTSATDHTRQLQALVNRDRALQQLRHDQDLHHHKQIWTKDPHGGPYVKVTPMCAH